MSSKLCAIILPVSACESLRLCGDLDFWRGRTDGRTDERTKVFQEVLADLKRAKVNEKDGGN